MRRLLVSTVVSLAWVVPALAQDAPAQAAAASAAHGQQDVVNQSVQSFEQRVHKRLSGLSAAACPTRCVAKKLAA